MLNRLKASTVAGTFKFQFEASASALRQEAALNPRLQNKDSFII